MDVIGGSLMKKSEWANLTDDEVLVKLSEYCVIVTPDDFSIPATVHNVAFWNLKAGEIGLPGHTGIIRTSDYNQCGQMLFVEMANGFVIAHATLKNGGSPIKYKEVRRSEYIRY